MSSLDTDKQVSEQMCKSEQLHRSSGVSSDGDAIIASKFRGSIVCHLSPMISGVCPIAAGVFRKKR